MEDSRLLDPKSWQADNKRYPIPRKQKIENITFIGPPLLILSNYCMASP